jgi:hypothetical protein
MTVRRLILVAIFAGVLNAAAPGRASADWYITPFVGGNFGGSADFGPADLDDTIERKVNFGASLGWMGAGIAGFEIDWGWSPNFFQDTVGPSGFTLGDSNVTTFMANLVLGIPIGGQTGGGVRPYATGGIGLLRSNVDADSFFTEGLTSNDFGVNVGGGLHGYFNDNVGLRGDLRYFRLLQENETSGVPFNLGLASFNFWRGSIGVTIRFGN